MPNIKSLLYNIIQFLEMSVIYTGLNVVLPFKVKWISNTLSWRFS